MSSGARAVIRLGALKHNLQRIREAANGARVIAVVKANAYGHGLIPVARNLADADALAVARYDEALELFDAGVRKPIVVLEGMTNLDELEGALARDLQPVVHCERQIELLQDVTAGDAVVWLKIDTGMRRLGFEPSQTPDLIARLERCGAVREVRLMTHFATADDRSAEMTSRQMEAFRHAAGAFAGDLSVANSPAVFGWPDCIRNGLDPGRMWVRTGICLYGASPFAGGRGSDLGLQPVMQFLSVLISVKKIRAGERVGYGATWAAPADTTLGIIAAGYGDGYSRFIPSGTPVLVDGRRAALAGLVSMDMAAVDLGPNARDRVGAPVTLWGDGLPVEEVAASAGTIPYQLLCGITGRPARVTESG